MNQITLEIALLVIGVLLVILLAALLLMQIMRASVFRIAQNILRVATAPKDDLENPVKPLAVPQHDRSTFIAEAGDFEAAVEAERRREGIAIEPDITLPGVPSGDPPSHPPAINTTQSAPVPLDPIPPEQGHPLHPR
ncbi:MAG TPA: hypothetical protein PLQ56_27110 [Aggregatilineales bacterium]|nr:hypothetical protein [Anaerolineae bacterium]HUN10303.1 hypothetical protein [Aggregatilineales bacterium]